MNIVVVNMVAISPEQGYAAPGKCGYFAVVNLKIGEVTNNPPGDGESVVVFPAQSLGAKRPFMMLKMSFIVGSLDAEARDPDSWPCRAYHNRCL